LESLAHIGVRRVSLGGALYRAAMSGFLRAVCEMRGQGTSSSQNRPQTPPIWRECWAREIRAGLLRAAALERDLQRELH